MIHPTFAYEIARVRHEEMLRKSEQAQRLAQLGHRPAANWRKNGSRWLRLLAFFF